MKYVRTLSTRYTTKYFAVTITSLLIVLRVIMLFFMMAYFCHRKTLLELKTISDTLLSNAIVSSTFVIRMRKTCLAFGYDAGQK